MRNFSVILLLVLALAEPASCQSPIELLRSAAKAGVHAAEIRFSAEIVAPSLSGERLSEVQSRQREALQAAVAMYKDQPELRAQYEAALSRNDDAVARQAEAYRNVSVMGLYRAFGPALGGDRLYEAKIKKGTDPLRGYYSLHRFLDYKDVRGVLFDVNIKTATVNNSPTSLGIPDPISMGHMSGPVLLGLKNEEAFSCEVDTSYKTSNPNEVCIRFEMRGYTSGTEEIKPIEVRHLVGRVVVDPSQGYVCPLFEYGNQGEKPELSITSSKFFQVKGSDAWFPEYSDIQMMKKDGLHSIKFSISSGDVVVYKILPQNLFSITIPAGTTLLYQLGDSHRRKAICDVEISIDGLDSLLSNKCLTTESGAPVGNPSLLLSILYPGLFFGLIFVAIYFGVRRWKQR
jgi:hypothetical protein